MSAPRVLITGGGGFIGSWLHRLFPEATIWDVKDGNDICENLPDEEFKYIFHLAAYKSVSRGEMYPRGYITNNCWGTVNLLKRYPDARIINVSSSAANECKSIYGITKYFAELAGNNHKNCLNVRLYNVFGEGQSTEYAAVVPTFIHASLTGTRPVIFGDGNQSRDFTYVGDVVHELKRLMFFTKETGLAHVGYGTPLSVLDLCHQICGKHADIHFLPKRSFDIEFSCSMTPMKMTFGREEGLKRTIDWWKEQHHASFTD